MATHIYIGLARATDPKWSVSAQPLLAPSPDHCHFSTFDPPITFDREPVGLQFQAQSIGRGRITPITAEQHAQTRSKGGKHGGKVFYSAVRASVRACVRPSKFQRIRTIWSLGLGGFWGFRGRRDGPCIVRLKILTS